MSSGMNSGMHSGMNSGMNSGGASQVRGELDGKSLSASVPASRAPAPDSVSLLLYDSRANSLVMHKSMSLEYEPASELLHISAKNFLLNRELDTTSARHNLSRFIIC